jgi:hypothetical protein
MQDAFAECKALDETCKKVEAEMDEVDTISSTKWSEMSAEEKLEAKRNTLQERDMR